MPGGAGCRASNRPCEMRGPLNHLRRWRFPVTLKTTGFAFADPYAATGVSRFKVLDVGKYDDKLRWARNPDQELAEG
eukprot:3054445-Prymnesium_polylepis.1